MGKDTIELMCSYNLWANEQLLSFLNQQPKEAIQATIPSSFPSIDLTLKHMRFAEWLWLSRFKGQNPGKTEISENLSFSGGVFNGLRDTSQKLRAFCHDTDQETLNREMTYYNTSGERYTGILKHLIIHVVNHSTYHRGQIVTMCRAAEFSGIPQTDLVAYLRIE